MMRTIRTSLGLFLPKGTRVVPFKPEHCYTATFEDGPIIKFGTLTIWAKNALEAVRDLRECIPYKMLTFDRKR